MTNVLQNENWNVKWAKKWQWKWQRKHHIKKKRNGNGSYISYKEYNNHMGINLIRIQNWKSQAMQSSIVKFHWIHTVGVQTQWLGEPVTARFSLSLGKVLQVSTANYFRQPISVHATLPHNNDQSTTFADIACCKLPPTSARFTLVLWMR